METVGKCEIRISAGLLSWVKRLGLAGLLLAWLCLRVGLPLRWFVRCRVS